MTRFRYWLGRKLRGAARVVEPTVTPNWEHGSMWLGTSTTTASATTVTVTPSSTTWRS